MAANSLLPADAAADDAAFDQAFEDDGLKRIDRGTVGELAEICTRAAAVQRKLDELDAGLNPLGLSDRAIPFDITPIGGDYGLLTHYEQIRERAGTALSNARTVLDRAQSYSNRLRLLHESNASYEDKIAAEEAAFTKELVGYYGTPYSDDIGPGGTYVQGYDGPDLVHYTWMDLSKFGLTSVDDRIAVSLVKYPDIAKKTEIATIKSQMNNQKLTNDIAYAVSASGLVVKPANITGSRQTQGSIQEKYADFLLQYIETKNAITAYDNAVDEMDVQYAYSSWMTGCETVLFVAKQAINIYRGVKIGIDAGLQSALNVLDYAGAVGDDTYLGLGDAVPKITGAGMTVNVDPSAIVKAALAAPYVSLKVANESAKLATESLMLTMDTVEKELDNAVSIAENTVSYYSSLRSLANDFKGSVGAVNAAYNEVQLALAKLNICVEAFNDEVAK